MGAIEIYGLTHPITREVKYVGKSVCIHMRYHQHLWMANKSARPTHLYKWIKELLDQGLKPGIIVLEEVNEDNWRERERHWIAHYGFENLCNMDPAKVHRKLLPTTTITIRIPRRLDRSLKRAGKRLGIYHTALIRQCLIALVEPSEFGDMVLESVRAASAAVRSSEMDALIRNMKTPRSWTENVTYDLDATTVPVRKSDGDTSDCVKGGT